MRFGGSCSLRPGCLAPSSKLQAVRRWRPAIQATSTFGVNQAKPAYKISSRSWAPLIYSPTTLNLRTLNDQSMGDYNMDSINVEDYRRERGVPGIEDALDVFRVTVKVNPADLLLLPVRPTIGEEAEAAAKEQGADEKMAKIAAEQALASFDALIEVMREHGSFEYTLDRHLHMLPELEHTMGQRVLYIGNQGPGGEGAEVHDLKRLLVDLASKGCMVDKNNVWVLYHPGGRPDQLMEYHGITHGVSHGGRISVAWNDDLEDVLKGNSKSPTTVRSRALDVGQISGGAIQREKPRQPEPTETEVATDTDMDLSAQDLDRLKMLWYDQPATFQGNPTLYDPTQAVWWSLTVFDPSTVEWGGLELADRPPIQPDLKTFRAWVENTEMWSVLDLITVPYPEDTMDDRMAGRSAYERNPVEIKKATDLNPYASNILTAACSPVNSSECKAALDILHGYAEYCEEGKVNAKNVGLCVPLNWRSVEEGRIDRGAFTWFAEMAAAFESRSPEQAWKWLRDEGYIDEDQFSILQYRGYIHQRLRVLDDSVRSWTDYRPKGVETNPQEDGYGLYTRPVTAVTLTAHYMASNFPREELTKGFLKGVDKVLSLAEDNAARQSLVALAQGRGLVEVTPQAVAGMLAIALLDGILRLTRPKLLEKMRYEDMNDADKEKLDNYLDKFHALAVNPALDRDTLVVEIKKLNDEFRDVKFQSLQGRMGQTIPSKEIRALQFYTPLQGIECPKGAPFMPEMVGHHHLAFMVNDHYRN